MDIIYFVLPILLQGGLIGLAAATVGLTSEAAQHLEVRAENELMVMNIFCAFFLSCQL